MSWKCGVNGCGRSFTEAEVLLRHQATQHIAHTCKICDQSVLAGYFAIKHAFDCHRRSEYVRAYGATPEAIRRREALLAAVTDAIDGETMEDILESERDSRTPEPVDH